MSFMSNKNQLGWRLIRTASPEHFSGRARLLASARSGRGAVRGAGCGQRVEQCAGQAGAGVPDLERDDLVGAGVVVDQTPVDLFAEDVLGVAGGQPGDVGLAVVIGVAGSHCFEDPASLPLGPGGLESYDGLVQPFDREVGFELQALALDLAGVFFCLPRANVVCDFEYEGTSLF